MLSQQRLLQCGAQPHGTCYCKRGARCNGTACPHSKLGGAHDVQYRYRRRLRACRVHQSMQGTVCRPEWPGMVLLRCASACQCCLKACEVQLRHQCCDQYVLQGGTASPPSSTMHKTTYTMAQATMSALACGPPGLLASQRSGSGAMVTASRRCCRRMRASTMSRCFGRWTTWCTRLGSTISGYVHTSRLQAVPSWQNAYSAHGLAMEVAHGLS